MTRKHDLRERVASIIREEEARRAGAYHAKLGNAELAAADRILALLSGSQIEEASRPEPQVERGAVATEQVAALRDSDVDNLLDELDAVAREYDSYDFGLPLIAERTSLRRQVQGWYAQLRNRTVAATDELIRNKAEAFDEMMEELEIHLDGDTMYAQSPAELITRLADKGAGVTPESLRALAEWLDDAAQRSGLPRLDCIAAANNLHRIADALEAAAAPETQETP